MELLVILFFSFLLLCTILKEIQFLDFLFNRFHTFMLFIPSWSFFAPVPLMHDFELFCRLILADGSLGDWQLIFAGKERPIYSFLWNPDRKFLKAFVDLALDLMKFCHQFSDKNQICMSIPYLQILNFVNHQYKNTPAKSVQFVIVRRSKLFDAEIVFRSEAHPIFKTGSEGERGI